MARFLGLARPINSVLRTSDQCAFDIVSAQGCCDKASAFHLFNKLREIGTSRIPSGLGHTHGLPDDHETLRQNPQSTKGCSILFKLLTHPGSHCQMLLQKTLHNCRRGRNAHQRGMRQRTREKQIVSTAFANCNRNARLVDLIIADDRRIMTHGVEAFNQDIWSSETDFLSTLGVYGKK